MSDLPVTRRVEISPVEQPMAFGESLGLELPTRYTPHAHETIDILLAFDSVLTPPMLGLTQRTVWFCRGLAALLLFLRNDDSNLPLRRRLEIEALAGLLLMALAWRGTISRRFLDRLYLIFEGTALVGNSLMTEIE
ncbi:MAG TPA: hypothetical protein VKQ72_23045 [Aggregatilineales bacterium]|nr:hypothetical protein [Aggregatilineales bacterium]